MGRKKIYDNEHQTHTIKNWGKRGLLCREGETYKDIYYLVMSIDNCELCNVEFTEEIKNQRCMDHDHNTGFFRKVLCRSCNASYLLQPRKSYKKNKTGHLFISPMIRKRNGNISVSFRYERKGFNVKGSSLTKLIALSFIHLLKKPI